MRTRPTIQARGASYLRERESATGIMRRARWGTARRPDPKLVARNLRLSPIRSAVERSFAAMKQWYGYQRVRYRSLARNGLQLHLMCIAINLRRALVLSPV